MENLEKYLDSIGEKGSLERLEAIALLNLGERSKSADIAVKKRKRRKELINIGLSLYIARIIVNQEYN
jgi:hypothetical protein